MCAKLNMKCIIVKECFDSKGVYQPEIVEKARAIELGADYCLLHPLTYDDFKTALVNATSSKHG